MRLFIKAFKSVDVPMGNVVEETSFSLSKVVDEATTLGNIPENVVGAFSVSILVLLLFTVAKYFIGNGLSKKEWGDVLLEFPIDLGVAVTTLLTTLFSCLNPYVYLVLILISSLLVVGCCMIRRTAIELMDNYSRNGFALLGALSLFIVVVWIVFLAYIIF